MKHSKDFLPLVEYNSCPVCATPLAKFKHYEPPSVQDYYTTIVRHECPKCDYQVTGVAIRTCVECQKIHRALRYETK